jgi:hypothetical protein
VHELPWSQITEGAVGLANASDRNPSLLELNAKAAAEYPQYLRKSRLEMVDMYAWLVQ